MDIQTRPSGTFARVSTPAPTWLDQNRRTVVRASVVGVGLLFCVIAGSIWVSNQSQRARDAFSNAMDVYDSPLQQAGQPPIPNVKTYSSAAARAKDANPLFRDAAGKYGWFKAGMNAEYFAGLTDEDMGRTADAEGELKKAAGGRDAGPGCAGKDGAGQPVQRDRDGSRKQPTCTTASSIIQL